MWLQSSGEESRDWADKNWNVFAVRPNQRPLRFLYQDTESNVAKCDFTILKPQFDKQTLLYEDIEGVLTEFYTAYLETTERNFAFVARDQQVKLTFLSISLLQLLQVWIKLWMLKYNKPISIVG